MSRATIRLQHLISIESGARTEFYDTEVEHAISIGGEHIQNGRFHLDENLRIVPIDFYKKRKTGWVVPGDTLLVKDGATIGKSMYVGCMPKRAMMVNEHVFVLRPRGIENRFLSYLIQSQTVQDTIWSLNVAAAQPGLSRDFAKHVFVTVTQHDRQRAIADYLDTETRRIDALVEKNQRLVELLKERRLAIITQAVTKGLDHGVAMKDSSIEWLGEIPVHWQVKRLKHVATIREDKLNRKPDNSVYVGLEDMESWSGRLNIKSDTNNIESNVNLFSARDVLFGKLRPYLAKVAIAPVDGVSTTEIVAIRAFADTSADFLFYRLLNRQLIDYADGMTYGAKMPRVSPEQLGNSPHPIPPLSEQRGIADFLDAETARIDTLVSKLQRQIDLLTERRQAVITAAVTGKLEIRT